MRQGGSTRHVWLAVCFGTSLAMACGGQSQSAGGDDSASDPGPTGAVGGSVATGGASAGGAGVPQGGTTGSCPECVPASYQVVVYGDGAPRSMTYNGTIIDHSRAFCSDAPVRGSVGGCVRSIDLSACQDPQNGAPCLEVHGDTAFYMSTLDGPLWSGSVIADVASTAPPGAASGTLTIQLSAGGDALMVLTVEYTICAEFGTLRIVC